MRIRKETGPWNWNAFLKVAGITAFFYALFLVLDFFGGDGIRLTSWFYVIFYPIVFGSIYANSMRPARVFVNDHQSISEFKNQLLEKLTKEDYDLVHSGENTIATPGRGFRKLAQRWFGSEQITITWGEEIVVSGSTRPVSWIEDVLTWNPAFRYSPATN